MVDLLTFLLRLCSVEKRVEIGKEGGRRIQRVQLATGEGSVILLQEGLDTMCSATGHTYFDAQFDQN